VAAVAAGRARLAELKERAARGAIRLLFGDESEVSTHPYLAHTWAPKGFDLKVQAPGQAKRRALLGVRDTADGELLVEVSTSKRSSDFIRLLESLDRRYGWSSLQVPATHPAGVRWYSHHLWLAAMPSPWWLRHLLLLSSRRSLPLAIQFATTRDLK
jgi:DDE superfamily endonuclease